MKAILALSHAVTGKVLPCRSLPNESTYQTENWDGDLAVVNAGICMRAG